MFCFSFEYEKNIHKVQTPGDILLLLYFQGARSRNKSITVSADLSKEDVMNRLQSEMGKWSTVMNEKPAPLL